MRDRRRAIKRLAPQAGERINRDRELAFSFNGRKIRVSAGWGTYGFKAAPIVGKTMAELIATGATPELIEPFNLERFYADRLVSEVGAAAVSH